MVSINILGFQDNKIKYIIYDMDPLISNSEFWDRLGHKK